MDQNKILDSIKTMLNIGDDDTAFDTDILVHINSAVANLTQIGVGPKTGFNVTANSTWDEYLHQDNRLASAKDYIYMFVNKIFNPNLPNGYIQACDKQMEEIIWRLRTTSELDLYDQEHPEENLESNEENDEVED